MAWVAFHHHRRRLEDGHSDLCDRELLVVGFLRGDHRSIGGQHEVNARIGHQIGLEPDRLCLLDHPFGGFIATQLWSCEKADGKSETSTDQTI